MTIGIGLLVLLAVLLLFIADSSSEISNRA